MVFFGFFFPLFFFFSPSPWAVAPITLCELVEGCSFQWLGSFWSQHCNLGQLSLLQCLNTLLNIHPLFLLLWKRIISHLSLYFSTIRKVKLFQHCLHILRSCFWSFSVSFISLWILFFWRRLSKAIQAKYSTGTSYVSHSFWCTTSTLPGVFRNEICLFHHWGTLVVDSHSGIS